MSRENFFVQLKGTDGKQVYVHLDNITSVKEVPAKDKQEAFTVVSLVGGTVVEVQEPMAAIMQKAASVGVAKIVG